MTSSIPSLRAIRRQVLLITVACNWASGLLIAYLFGYVLRGEAWLERAGEGLGSHGSALKLISLVLALWCVVCVAASLRLGRRDRGVDRWYESLSSGGRASEVPADVQRRVLNQAPLLAATSLGFWVVAGALFGGLLMRSVSVFLVIAGVPGVLSAGLVLPLVERAWRPVVPVFFPEGRLAQVRAFRLSVMRRLLLSFLLVGLYPTGLLAATSLARASALIGAADPSRILSSLIVLEATLVAVSVAVAIGMAVAVTHSIVEPLGQLQRAMSRVAEDDLEAHAPVTTADELGYVAERFNDMVAGLRQGEVVRDLLSQYVSPQVARHAVETGAELGGQMTECSVVFADIRDFTALTQRLSPDALVALLNRFMSAMVQVVAAHGGIVNKFGGDSLLAVFGTPLNPTEAHAASAVRTALAMRDKLAEVNHDPQHQGAPPLRIGVGVASGRVVAGNIGGRGRIEYTVIGEAVNLASRLQTVTKEVGRDILLHADTYAAASSTLALACDPLPPLHLQGIEGSVQAYAL